MTATNIGGMGSDGHIRSIEDDEATFYYHTPGQRVQDRPLTIDNKLHVFPNPASNVINVHLNGERMIESIEMYEKTLLSIPKNQKNVLLRLE